MIKTVLPPATIGIIGGGQLGKMMAVAAKNMGYKVICLDPSDDCPCASVCDEHIVGSLSSKAMLQRLCQASDVVTYEWENVSAACIEELEKTNVIPQGSTCLEISQDRLIEKNFVSDLQIPTCAYASVELMEELQQAVNKLGYPCILKTCRNGYDGKGQIRLYSDADLSKCEELMKYRVACILESFVDFEYEISIIVNRSISGVTFFPIPRNIHRNGILQYAIVPSGISKNIQEKAEAIGKQIIEAMNYYGTMAVELFVKNEEIYFNEMAPRVHNSGHYTIEGCSKSQFATHIEAICGLRVDPIIREHDCVMWNVLGQDMNTCMELMKTDYISCGVHLYGKQECKVNRKMGHVTFFGNDVNALEKRAKGYGEKNGR